MRKLECDRCGTQRSLGQIGTDWKTLVFVPIDGDTARSIGQADLCPSCVNHIVHEAQPIPQLATA